ncbi:MAG TPA: FAD-binding protein [Candidatus Sulfotelmatobacter sp.]|nr:FAD-binding protein [Candidatus Sulfotelmatobacter sp.]
MKGLPAETDFVVIGASVAGLRAAIELAPAGRVLLLNKKEIPNFSAVDAKSQASWLSDEDDISLHLQDTLDCGDGLCNLAAVKLLLEEAPERIDELMAWGKSHGTALVFGPENAHSRGRVLHAEGQPAGREIYRILCEKLQSVKHVTLAPSTFVTGLFSEGGQVTGVSVLDEKGTPHDISCSAVLLATGGLAQIYRNTTNPDAATGDGVALGFRAGAELSDLEFIQFHPTTLYMKKVPRIPLPEMILEQGGYLRNFELNRFMGKYHPAGERAPRDLMLRAIMHEMEVSGAKDPFVYLDLTHLRASVVQKQFHRIYETCMAHNLDITEDVIPVRPAAQFCVGGVRTDLNGNTNVRGLYAAGEAAGTGVHGANRLPSNGLLECLVFGTRAGKAMAAMEKKPAARAEIPPRAAYSNGPVEAGVEELIGQIQDLMWKDVGIVRTRSGMQKAVKTLEEMAPKLAHPKTRRGHEAANLRLSALLVARSALAREESRGAHYRMEYPDHDDKKFLKHSVVRGDKVVFLN